MGNLRGGPSVDKPGASKERFPIDELRDRARLIGSNVRSFAAYASAARARAGELRAKLSGEPQPAADTAEVLSKVSEELGVVEEELHVADDELRQQNGELIRLRIAAESDRQRYLDLFESAPDPYFVTDRQGMIREANRAAALALQMTASFLVGKPLVNFIARSDCKKLRAALTRLGDGERVDHLELRVRPRQHKPIFLADITASSTRSIRGAPMAIRWQMRDVTVRAKDLLATGDGEEGIASVRERLAQLTNAHDELTSMLRSETERRQLAERAGAARDEFLATVSHELRAPLTAILGWSHLLRTDHLDDDTRAQALEAIERSARSQAKLISDLVEASRIIAGRLRLSPTPLELEALVHKARHRVRLAAEEKSLTLSVETERCEVAGDADRLEQVIVNLLSNAIKFTPSGGRVWVSLSTVGAFAKLVIRDSGRGISKDVLPSVFDRFRQSGDGAERGRDGANQSGEPTGRSGAGFGLGLGLGIVRHLVELHKGEVSADSDGPDCGSTFTVMLPLIDATPATSDLDFPPTQPPPAASVRGVRVLIVDEDAATQSLLRLLLEHHGAKVAAVASVDDALGLIEGWDPHVVTCAGEKNLAPGALIARLRTSGGRMATLPAIAILADAEPEDLAEAIAAGYQRHLAKPIEPVELLYAIATLARRP